MSDIRDESGAIIGDERPQGIEDEAGGGWLIVSDGFHAHVIKPPEFEISGGELTVSDSYLSQLAEKPPFAGVPLELIVQDAFHGIGTDFPELSEGGTHDNTEHIVYSGQDYLRCKHAGGNLTGVYTSEVFDIGAVEGANRHLVYVVGEDDAEVDIAIVGAGTTWGDKFPAPTTWTEGGALTLSWAQIFSLDKAPRVSMRLYYGSTSPPTSYIDKMEILSGIISVPGDPIRYFRVRITIVDPNINVYAYVEAFDLKFATYT